MVRSRLGEVSGRREILYRLVGLGGTLALAACGGARPSAGVNATAGPTIVTTTTILADWARNVGGGRVAVSSLLAPGAEAHAYDPSPADVAALETAQLVLVNGAGYDEWARRLAKGKEAAGQLLAVAEQLELLTSDDGEFPRGDPHYWFDPARVKTAVLAIEAALKRVDPAGSGQYASAAAAYNKEVDALDADLRTTLSQVPPARRKLVTNHEALRYLAERYGYTVVGTVIPSLSDAGDPSAKDIADLIAAIRREQVPAIFAESGTKAGVAEQVAGATGAKVVSGLFTESLGAPGSGVETYLTMMRHDARLIARALG